MAFWRNRCTSLWSRLRGGWPWLRGARHTPSTWQPGWVFKPGDTDTAHRRRLVADLHRSHPGARAAHALIEAECAGQETACAREHAATHVVRYLQTWALVPDGPGRLADVGGPSIHNVPLAKLKGWDISTIEILSIDYETDRLPYPDASQDGVLLCEVIEHFVIDPMFCLIEINRILKPGGFVVVSTPNAASWFSIYQALRQMPPNRWSFYSADPAKARNHIHAREYLVWELRALIEAAGFDIETILTRDYGISPAFCAIPGYPDADRGETIFCRARKVGGPRKRHVNPPYLEDRAYPNDQA